MASEGKSTTAVNLGVTMARAGRRVVLVDLDLRRPRMGDFFDLEDGPGFTSVLVGDAPLSEALVAVEVATGVPPLQLLTSGPVPPNPSELMGASRVSELLIGLQSIADLVIIDSPPLIPVTDALVLSGRVDGVLLVVAAGQTRRRHLGRAVELLQQAEAPLLGAVLNATSTQHRRYGYGYGYGSPYAYGEKDGSRRRALSRS
jgi:non-specific protein-tyrosine kinase